MTENKERGGIKGAACKVPIPAAGLMLGLASAGNMVPDIRPVFGALSLTVLAFLILRIIYDPKNFKQEMRNPAIAGIAPTIPMGVSILTTYTQPTLPDLSYAIWIAMILLHVGLMVYFTKTFLPRTGLNKLLPCYFVVYVGITVGSVVAPAYGAYDVGKALFWFGFISYLVLLPLLVYRTVVVRSIPEPLLPTVAIFAAPASLCLAGYLRSFESKELWLVSLMLVLSIASYFAIILYLPRLIRVRFYPSCSAFTFPLVISAIATNATYTYLLSEGIDQPLLQYLAWGEIALALVIITYVLARYLNFFLPKRGAKTT